MNIDVVGRSSCIADIGVVGGEVYRPRVKVQRGEIVGKDRLPMVVAAKGRGGGNRGEGR